MYVIAGVTGHTGKAAAEALLDAGKRVRVVVRDAKKGEAWSARGAEVAVASLDDAAALGRALEGALGAYLLLPPNGFGDTRLRERAARFRTAMVEAVIAARPKHVVFLSSIGAQHPSGTGPIAELHHVEQDLKKTGVPATFLRAGYFMENWGASVGQAVSGGSLFSALAAGLKIPMIATQDIGRVAAELLLEPITNGTRVIELAGPADYTIEDAAAAVAHASGKPVRAAQIPVPALIDVLRGMGASDEVARTFGELNEGINVGRIAWAPPAEGALLRRGGTPLARVVDELVAQSSR
jgi:uncharacterized protein YbjT (DUF2867 family)